MKFKAPKIKPIFAWYDLWSGFYWDREKRALYWLPIPTLGLKITFGRKPRIQRVPVEDAGFFYTPYLPFSLRLLSLDDAIQYIKKEASKDTKYDQLVEWLEELRELRGKRRR